MIPIVPEGTEQAAPIQDIQHYMRPGTLRLRHYRRCRCTCTCPGA